MDVQTERYLDPLDRVEVLAGPEADITTPVTRAIQGNKINPNFILGLLLIAQHLGLLRFLVL